MRRSVGGAEAGFGLTGHGGDPFWPEHRRELAKHTWQVPGRHHRYALHDDLALGDPGAMDSHDRHHHQARVGQDPSGLVGLERHRPQGGVRGSSTTSTVRPLGVSWLPSRSPQQAVAGDHVLEPLAVQAHGRDPGPGSREEP